MKTSNKLLIALAVSLIIIPIIVIAVNVKINYKNEKAFYKNLKGNTDLKSELDGYTVKELPDFSSVNLNDGNDSYVNFVVVNSDKSGIKIPSDLTEMYDIKVDNNNTLQINLKNSDKKLKYSLTAYIYSSSAKNFNISRAAGFTLDIKTDTITVNAKNVNRLNFQELTAINYLKINTDKVGDLNFSNTKINNINIYLNNSNFRSLKSIFQSVNINSVGKSNIEIYGDERDKTKYQINSLAIKTTGITELNIDFVKVAQSTGSLSDSTRISGSASILKSMLKN
ncbi:GIN domain-containing protein [Pedobacter sp.]|uniref:GIN domain-containing protein n=1 Tax=Pedobacter sp. TaxID=1411316 RepID=UPI003BAD2FCD